MKRLLLSLLFTLGFGPLPAVGVTLLTYNVAEFSDSDPERISRLIQQIAALEPDIIHLQEAQKQTLKQLGANPHVKRHYAQFHAGQPNSLPRGGRMILTKKALKARQSSYSEFPSEMDRGMLSVQVSLCDHSHVLANLHLESPDLLFWRSQRLRARQVEILGGWGKQHPANIIAGDFNTFLDATIDHHLKRHGSDVWDALRGNEPGLTWDPQANPMASWHGLLRFSGSRLDRVLFRSDVLLPTSITLIGVNATTSLSDHYGLLAEFACQGTNRP
jgi:endonuclease/exonuclease/phosphatase family metal-dependent hydrolase